VFPRWKQLVPRKVCTIPQNYTESRPEERNLLYINHNCNKQLVSNRIILCADLHSNILLSVSPGALWTLCLGALHFRSVVCQAHGLLQTTEGSHYVGQRAK
jgi:hypothetical protein